MRVSAQPTLMRVLLWINIFLRTDTSQVTDRGSNPLTTTNFISMTNRELYKLIVCNFTKRWENKKTIEWLLYNEISLGSYDCFIWRNTPEGYNFWEDIYDRKFDCSKYKFLKFMKRYYFENSCFINLNYFV